MITGEQVKIAMIAADIKRVAHHSCSICGFMTAYIRCYDELFFDSGCECCYNPNSLHPRSWDEAARWIEMQDKPEIKADLMKAFGLKSALCLPKADSRSSTNP
jgi:hypothetical protein